MLPVLTSPPPVLQPGAVPLQAGHHGGPEDPATQVRRPRGGGGQYGHRRGRLGFLVRCVPIADPLRCAGGPRQYRGGSLGAGGTRSGPEVPRGGSKVLQSSDIWCCDQWRHRFAKNHTRLSRPGCLARQDFELFFCVTVNNNVLNVVPGVYEGFKCN